MVTSEAIKKANQQLATMDIKGKEYVLVNQRIKAFREIWPNGSIQTEIISLDKGVVLMKAVVKDETDRVLATGLAYEKENSSFINKTSFIENCETSAVGRALGMCGLGVDVSVASAEEMGTAVANQDPKPKKKEPAEEKPEVKLATKEQVLRINELYDMENIDKMCKFYRVTSVDQISEVEAGKAIKMKEMILNGTSNSQQQPTNH